MATKTFDIEINSKHQLLDLNNDLVNFDLNFKVTAENETEFQGLVLSKDELDKYPDLNDIEMKSAPGYLKGNINANDNEYQNYFLILKKQDGSVKANVELEIEELKSLEVENNTEVQKHENKLLSFYHEYFYHIVFALIMTLVLYYAYSFISKKKNIILDALPTTTDIATDVTSNVGLPTTTDVTSNVGLPTTTDVTSNVGVPENIKTYLKTIE